MAPKTKETRHPSDHKKSLVKLIQEASYSRSTWEVFSDFVGMSAISLSNAVDFIHREEREAQYLETIGKYQAKEQALFPRMFAHLVEALEEKLELSGPADVLGQVYHELELHNKWKGQFFTPLPVCEMMAQVAIGDHETAIREKGYFTVCEPCVGSGAMVLGLAKALRNSGYVYQNQMLVTATDVDIKCVHMAYIQLALYGIPAVIIHGNSLTVEEWSRWYTPTYMLDGWVWRAHCGATTQSGRAEEEMIKCAMEPMYAALKKAEALMEPLSGDDLPAGKFYFVFEQECVNQLSLS